MRGITKGTRRITNSREQVWKSIGARETTTYDAPCVTPRCWNGQQTSKDSASSTSCRTAASEWHAPLHLQSQSWNRFHIAVCDTLPRLCESAALISRHKPAWITLRRYASLPSPARAAPRSDRGGWPKARMKARRIRSGSRNPVVLATRSIASLEDCRAAAPTQSDRADPPTRQKWQSRRLFRGLKAIALVPE